MSSSSSSCFGRCREVVDERERLLLEMDEREGEGERDGREGLLGDA